MNRIIQNLTFATAISLTTLSAGAAFAAAPPAKEAKAAAQHVMGSIVSVSAKEHTIKLQTPNGEHVYSVAPQATFTNGGKAVPLGDLKSGQKLDATVTKANGKDLIKHGELSA